MRALVRLLVIELLACALGACGEPVDEPSPWLRPDGWIDHRHVSDGVAVFADGGEITVRDRARAVVLEPFGSGDIPATDVWAASRDDVWVTGSRLAHWDGRAWSYLELPEPVDGVPQRFFANVCGCPDGSRWVVTSLRSEAEVLYRVDEAGSFERIALPEDRDGEWIGDVVCDAQALWIAGRGGWMARVDDAWLDVTAGGHAELAVGDRVVFQGFVPSSQARYAVEELVDGEVVRTELDLALVGRSWGLAFDEGASYSEVTEVAIGAPGEVWMHVQDVEIVLVHTACSTGGWDTSSVPCDRTFHHVRSRHLFHRWAGEWTEVDLPGELPIDAGAWSTPEERVLEVWSPWGLVRIRAPG